METFPASDPIAISSPDPALARERGRDAAGTVLGKT